MSRVVATVQVPEKSFLGASAVLFAATAATTVVWCASMSAMGTMPMPGGWRMSMTWMRMPGQTWPGAAAAFVAMWFVMMAAMMLPSLVPMLMRYRRAAARSGGSRLGLRTILVSAGYFLVWTALGLVIFPLGAAISIAAMKHAAVSRAVPVVAAAVIVLAGWLQLTAWKARQLACCREEPGSRAVRGGAGAAWRHGVRLGLACVRCCAGLTAVLIVLGVMDLRAMALVAAATTVERVAPAGERIARATGALVFVVGVLLIMRVTAFRS